MIREAGFSTIEVSASPGHLDVTDRQMVKRAAEQARTNSLEVYSVHAPFSVGVDITSTDSKEREHAVQVIYNTAEAAAMLEARYLVLHPGPEEGSFSAKVKRKRLENGAESLAAISTRCQQLGHRLVLENMLPHLFASHVEDLLWLMGALHSRDIGFCLDTGHATLTGDLPDVAEKLAGHVRMLHVHDNRGTEDEHLAPGEGDINWERLLGHLSTQGFNGSMIIEMNEGQDDRQVLRRAAQGRLFLRKLAQRLDRPRPHYSSGQP
jgi:sugar phosphate isomerase/epimerase